MKASIHLLCVSILLADVAAAGGGARRVRPAAPAVASAAAAAPHADVLTALQNGFVAAWTSHQRQRSRFSRMAMPPNETRARLEDPAPRTDARGDVFFTFAIDTRERYSDEPWARATLTGCIYPAQGVVYVKRGDAYRTADAFLGKKGSKAPEHACAGPTT